MQVENEEFSQYTVYAKQPTSELCTAFMNAKQKLNSFCALETEYKLNYTK